MYMFVKTNFPDLYETTPYNWKLHKNEIKCNFPTFETTNFINCKSDQYDEFKWNKPTLGAEWERYKWVTLSVVYNVLRLNKIIGGYNFY